MLNKQKEIDVFLALLRAGLWEKEVRLSQYGDIDYLALMELAEEQSVIGLITAGLQKVTDIEIPEIELLQFVGSSLQIEQQNKEMNKFLAWLIEKFRENDIYAILIKGQGVAQCYERPLWRSSGDLDFYLSDDNFQKAKQFFRPLVDKFDPDNDTTRHINMHMGEWVVEIHGNQYSSLSSRINKVMDEVHRDLFFNGNVRCWQNEKTLVFLPYPNNDVIIIFVHFLGHFYKGGIGVRQICDWCRLLWTYRESLDLELLESRIKRMGLMSEWKVFGVMAVEYLGMPREAMPFYNSSFQWHYKADKVLDFILKVGNFGHNRDNSYYSKYPFLIRKTVSLCRRVTDVLHHISIFPFDSLRFFVGMTISGLQSVAHGE